MFIEQDCEFGGNNLEEGEQFVDSTEECQELCQLNQVSHDCLQIKTVLTTIFRMLAVFIGFMIRPLEYVFYLTPRREIVKESQVDHETRIRFEKE